MSVQSIAEGRRNGGILTAKHGAAYTVAAVSLSPQVALRSSACLIGALCILLRLAAVAATPADVVYAGTSGALYSALANPEVSTVYLIGTVKLDSKDWALSINISRNVTVAAPPQFQAIGAYITVDFSNVVAGIYVKPGGQITFRWLELVSYVEEVGQAMLLIGASPGGRVVFDRVVQRRLAGLGGKQTLEELLRLPRLDGAGSNQTAFFLPRFCFNSTRDGSPHCSNDLVYVVDVAARLAPASSMYFAAGVPLGEYDMLLEESVQLSDVAVDPNCLPGASVWECVVRQLKLLAIPPVLIKAKASASNLVKIVASLAVLMVSVALFLYFRRHYMTYQERRARRMRRIREALGMGREAHGVMFNGLDGEVPDWQIMPMPGGYAPDEGGMEELHQDSHLRNLMKDMSTRPNLHIPDYGTEDNNEVRIEVGGPDDNCPIAEEVGLRRTPVRLQIGGGGSAAAAAPAATDEPTEDPESPSQSPAGLPADRWRGQGAIGPGKEGSCGKPPPVAAAVAGGKGARSGGAAADAAGETVLGVQPSGGSGTSATSVSRTIPMGQGGPGQLPPPVAMQAVGGGITAAGQSSSSCGRGGGSQGMEIPSTMSVTKAGMDLLMASRAAATAAAGGSGRSGGAGSGGTTAAQAGSRIHGSSRGSPRLPQQRSHDQQHAEGVAAAAGSAGGQLLDGGGAAASHHAVTAAAADLATRVLRSKEGDDDIQEEASVPNNGTRVASLMDELDELRRDIMAGINDTQLQIMSVVGSGAFGTVYRGQWQGLEVAVKTVVFSASSENRKRALQEAALCQSINHRNIVATYAVDVQPLGAVNMPVLVNINNRNNATLSNLLDWRLYIVQEFCDGGPLRKLVQSQYLLTTHGPNMLVICELALELAHALAHLHSKNVIHGDLNPNNVLLKRDASAPIGFRVKMADFGLSVMVPLQKTHMSNLRLGTLYYIAPETCFRGQLGYAADVFSLGVMLWELYHGRLAGTRTAAGEPRYQPDFPDFPPACPVDYRKLAHRCLQKQPHNRLHSSQVVQRLQEMLVAFRAAALAAPSTAPPPLPPLPLGGPDDTALPLPPAQAGPLFTHHALAAAAASGTPTPAESRHNPTSPSAGAAGGGSPEISPRQAATDSPRAPAKPNAGRR